MTRKILIHNARIWPDPTLDKVLSGSILVEDGVVRKVGAIDPEDRTHAETIDAQGRLVMPGLVQTHVHLCQTLMRGVAEDLPLLRWLREYIWPLEAAHDRESLRISALLACAALIRSGTTAVMTFETVRGTDVAFEVLSEVGLMGHISHCFMDDSGGYAPLAVPLSDAFRTCEHILQQWEATLICGWRLLPASLSVQPRRISRRWPASPVRITFFCIPMRQSSGTKSRRSNGGRVTVMWNFSIGWEFSDRTCVWFIVSTCGRRR